MLRFLITAAAIGVPAAGTLAVVAPANVPPSVEPHFVTIPEVVVPIIDSGRLNGRLRFGVVVDAADAESAARLTADVPRLQSDLIATGIEFSRLYVSALTPVDAKALAIEVDRSLRSQNPDVSRVLIVNVSAEGT
jgi:hypothetical protein